MVATDRCTPEAVLVRAIALLGLYPRSAVPLVDVLVGGPYGSEGKGNIVGHIAPEYSLLVRVGGPNAGHKVYAEPIPEAYFPPAAGSALRCGQRGTGGDELVAGGERNPEVCSDPPCRAAARSADANAGREGRRARFAA